jgi:serpin B
MIGQGARGRTRGQFQSLLGLGGRSLSLPMAANGYASLRKAFTTVNGAAVDVANGVWVDQRVGLKPRFAQTQSAMFGARIESLDMASPAASVSINDFVSKATRGRIPGVLGPAPPTKAVVLVSALYFKSRWAVPFERGDTKNLPFTRADGRVVQTPTMRRNDQFSYYEDATLQSVVLPYSDSQFELVLVLMKSPKSAPPIGWTSPRSARRYADRQGLILVPRLKLAWAGDLSETLRSMGMRTALGDQSDFGDVADRPLGSVEAIHKTMLLVDEDGSEGAAATMDAYAAATDAAPFYLRLDRPFYLLLREKQTGAPLFLAYVAEPGE